MNKGEPVLSQRIAIIASRHSGTAAGTSAMLIARSIARLINRLLDFVIAILTAWGA
jgi:hypothetical protein